MANDAETRLELIELLARYASMPDTKNFDDLPKTVLTDPVVWDFEAISGQPAEPVSLEALMRRQQQVFAGFQATHHSITNHRITLHGDIADIRAHLRAEHWVAPELAEPGHNCWLVVGFYDDEAVRTVDGWRIRRVRLTPTYQENTHLLGVAVAEGKRILGG
jgi:hypothetical protein